MPKRKNTLKLDFTGEIFYIGIDVHKKSWKVCIYKTNLYLKRFSMNPNPKELVDYMNKNYPNGTYNSVYEAGFCGFSTHRILIDLGFNNIIVNPADIPTTNKEKDRKSDPIDCTKLARELKNESLIGIYIPNINLEAIRSLGRYRKQVSKRSVQIKNRIKGFLYFLGIDSPKNLATSHWSRNYINWIKNLELENIINREILDQHLEDFEFNRLKKLNVIRKIRKEFKENKICNYLTSVPGIGFLSAFIIYSELLEIKRFKNLNHLSSFVGLVPSTKSSGEKDISTGITKRCSKELRRILVQSSWIAVRRDPVLTSSFDKLFKKMIKQKAIIKIAKKLLNRIRYVWINETFYDIGVIE